MEQAIILIIVVIAFIFTHVMVIASEFSGEDNQDVYSKAAELVDSQPKD